MKRNDVLAYVLVVVASVGASKLAADQSSSSLRHVENAYEHQRHTDQVAGCNRSILDRLLQIKLQSANEVGNLAVARDPTQSSMTRRARLEQAKVEKEAVAEYTTRVDPAHGGKLDCNTQAGPIIHF